MTSSTHTTVSDVSDDVYILCHLRDVVQTPQAVEGVVEWMMEVLHGKGKRA